jgi:hypothetical protein
MRPGARATTEKLLTAYKTEIGIQWTMPRLIIYTRAIIDSDILQAQSHFARNPSAVIIMMDWRRMKSSLPFWLEHFIIESRLLSIAIFLSHL